ncbi:hypothetical protein O181_074238 [Austropuccinia psidii MF-1]|uniref:Acyl-coenzyme A thioesterase 8 n=1 Tax=Austropuccinia psidii MF-1 TaxID=1389203 RepID=A0A9Q3FAN1_9BASI|nr:hypothetical protein [Austropuccinia psidii MF-1]
MLAKGTISVLFNLFLQFYQRASLAEECDPKRERAGQKLGVLINEDAPLLSSPSTPWISWADWLVQEGSHGARYAEGMQTLFYHHGKLIYQFLSIRFRGRRYSPLEVSGSNPELIIRNRAVSPFESAGLKLLMNPSTEAQRIEESLELEKIDDDLFKSIKLWKPVHRPGAFGGNIIAQAAHAATKTVTADFQLHSLHCYFIGYGDVSIPSGIIYLVDRIRDGRSYVTRSVKAVQRSRCIFTLLASYHRSEPSQLTLQAQIDLAGIPPPESCLSTEDKLETFINEKKHLLKPKLLEYLERELQQSKLNAIETRNTKAAEPVGEYGRSQTFWFRLRAKIRADPAYQKLVLAYASDYRFIGTVGKAMGLGVEGGKKLTMLASLDHSMFFYDHDIDLNDWMLYRMDAEAAKFGRGLVTGKIYSRDGRLLVVCTQEGVKPNAKFL